MRRASHPIMAARVTLAPGVHRPRRPQPGLDRTRLSTHPKQARYSTDYASICGTNIMRGTPQSHRRLRRRRSHARQVRAVHQVLVLIATWKLPLSISGTHYGLKHRSWGPGITNSRVILNISATSTMGLLERQLGSPKGFLSARLEGRR